MRLFSLLMRLVGAATAVSALMRTRTPQGTLAWIAALVFAPWVSVPAYFVFGRSRFRNYVTARRGDRNALRKQLGDIAKRLDNPSPPASDDRGAVRAVETLARMPYAKGNRVDLLVDGEATFASLFEGIDAAERTLVVQFYIVRDDEIGRALRDRLIAKAQAGVDVYFLYDAIGSYLLGHDYVKAMREAGVRVAVFRSTRGLGRLQVNFRNHRKIVVADGRVGWVGGHNVGDEYLGRGDRAWRDTHLRIEGPAALKLQLTFAEDWHWSTGETLDLGWSTRESEPDDGAPVLVIASGPADRLETASLLVQQLISCATERVWISSPYFVPDQATVHSLQLAVLRGVEVRLLLPDKADSLVVDLASHAALPPVLKAGVRVWRYEAGFLHSKTLLVDNHLAAVTTVNLDNRSFRLNFEVTALVDDEAFAADVAAMFEADFERSVELDEDAFESRAFAYRAAARAAHLASPVL